MHRKSFDSATSVKSAAEGKVSAVFSTFDVIDKDGDVTTSDAIKDGTPIIVSAYGHQSWSGALPVGKGVIRTTKSEAIAELQFFMDTTDGVDTFNAVSQLAKSGLGEWSYGFDVLDAEPATFDGQEVRMLKALKVYEVSPVLQGAGINTRTVGVKANADSPKPGAPYRAAIRPASTEVSEKAWDASSVIASLHEVTSVSDLRSVYAWVDPAGDPESKTSYKFAHHEGIDGPANIRACITGIAVLNGARGGAGIPESDRRGVYNHLAGHLIDSQRDVPELRAQLSYGSLKFADEAAAVMAAVSGLIERAKEIKTMRASRGRSMARGSVDILDWVNDELKQLRMLIDTPQVDFVETITRLRLKNMKQNGNEES